MASGRRALIVGPRVRGARELDQILLAAQGVKIHPRELESALKVGVDGGVAILSRAGLKPHFAVGDWDSLSGNPARALKGILHLTLPKRKDRSDLYYAARAAIEVGATELLCLGVTGGRPDHQLAMLSDLSEIGEKHPEVRAITVLSAQAQYHFLSVRQPQWRAKLTPGQIVSVFSLTGEAKGVTLQGFDYPLRGASLKPSSQGLSNRVVRGDCSVRLKRGRIVVIVLSMPYREER